MCHCFRSSLFSSFLLVSPRFSPFLLVSPHFSPFLLDSPHFSSVLLGLLISPRYSSFLLVSPRFSTVLVQSLITIIFLSLKEEHILPGTVTRNTVTRTPCLLLLRLAVPNSYFRDRRCTLRKPRYTCRFSLLLIYCVGFYIYIQR